MFIVNPIHDTYISRSKSHNSWVRESSSEHSVVMCTCNRKFGVGIVVSLVLMFHAFSADHILLIITNNHDYMITNQMISKDCEAVCHQLKSR